MTKRFVDYFDKDHNYIIQDLVNEDEYQVGFCNCDEDKFLELVNALAETSCDCITDCEIAMKKLIEENEQLKYSLSAHMVDLNNYKGKCSVLEEENEQLKQQINIFEKFLEVNDLSIDWDEFCGVDECAFENPNFSCKECIHLKGDAE